MIHLRGCPSIQLILFRVGIAISGLGAAGDRPSPINQRGQVTESGVASSGIQRAVNGARFEGQFASSLRRYSIGTDLYSAPEFKGGLILFGENVAMKIGGSVGPRPAGAPLPDRRFDLREKPPAAELEADGEISAWQSVPSEISSRSQCGGQLVRAVTAAAPQSPGTFPSSPTHRLPILG
jgi:hypothetical protein